jgi:hypothetical protein
MNPRHHARQPSQGRKVSLPHTRSSKPPPLTSRKSYNNHTQTNPHGLATGHALLSPTKTSSAWNKEGGAAASGVKDDAEESGMASFPQFWYLHRCFNLHVSRLTTPQHDLRETNHEPGLQYPVLFGSVSPSCLATSVRSLTNGMPYLVVANETAGPRHGSASNPFNTPYNLHPPCTGQGRISIILYQISCPKCHPPCSAPHLWHSLT